MLFKAKMSRNPRNSAMNSVNSVESVCDEFCDEFCGIRGLLQTMLRFLPSHYLPFAEFVDFNDQSKLVWLGIGKFVVHCFVV